MPSDDIIKRYEYIKNLLKKGDLNIKFECGTVGDIDKNKFLDEAGYPKNELITTIRNYHPDQGNIIKMIYLICHNWYHGEDGYKIYMADDGMVKLELHTLGWSGNEDVIKEVLKNDFLTEGPMKYMRWERGGHYYFDILEYDTTQTWN